MSEFPLSQDDMSDPESHRLAALAVEPIVHEPDDALTIDCASCVLRNIGCSDCVVTFLLGAPDEFEVEERRALAVLAESGLVPPLRLVASQPSAEAQNLGLPGAACG